MTTWRERLWEVPADCRLNVVDLAEALGRPKSFVYRYTRQHLIPCRELDGRLIFRAGDIRTWWSEHERVITTAGLHAVGATTQKQQAARRKKQRGKAKR
jgi:hypothetical protein